MQPIVTKSFFHKMLIFLFESVESASPNWWKSKRIKERACKPTIGYTRSSKPWKMPKTANMAILGQVWCILGWVWYIRGRVRYMLTQVRYTLGRVGYILHRVWTKNAQFASFLSFPPGESIRAQMSAEEAQRSSKYCWAQFRVWDSKLGMTKKRPGWCAKGTWNKQKQIPNIKPLK